MSAWLTQDPVLRLGEGIFALFVLMAVANIWFLVHQFARSCDCEHIRPGARHPHRSPTGRGRT